MHEPWTCVEYRHIKQEILRSKARQRVLIIDSCFSGRVHGLMSDSTEALKQHTVVEGALVITSTTGSAAALAPVGEEYTAFTGMLLETLRLGIDNGCRHLSASMVYNDVKEKLHARSLPEPSQTGRDRAGEILLARNAAYSDPGKAIPLRSAEFVRWADVGGDAFDQLVGKIISKVYGFRSQVTIAKKGRAVGWDIEVVQGGRRRLFESLYCPKGIGSSVVRSSARARLERAISTGEFFEWVLVVPVVRNDELKDFAGQLSAEFNVKVRTIDSVDLEDYLQKMPRLLDHIAPVHLVRSDGSPGRAGPFAARGLRDLSDRLREIPTLGDKDWTVDFARRGDMIVNTIRPRGPEAIKRNPIRVNITLAPGHEKEGEALQRLIDFGVSEKLVLSKNAVTALEVSGPEWAQERFLNVHVELLPADGLADTGALVELRFPETENKPASRHEGSLTHISSGVRGYTLSASFYSELTVSFLIPRGEVCTATCELFLYVGGMSPAAALRALDLAREITSRPSFSFYVDGAPAWTLEAPMSEPANIDDELRDLEMLVADLDVVQRHSGVYFAIPEEVSAVERVRLRFGRLLAEGNCLVNPECKRLSGTLSGFDDPVLRALVEGEGRALAVHFQEWTLLFQGREIPFGSVVAYHPHVVAEDPKSVLNALDAQLPGTPIALVPQGGRYYHFYIPEKINGKEGAEPFSSWGLHGYSPPQA